MSVWSLPASGETLLTWDYGGHDDRLATLCAKAAAGQWSAAADVDWSVEVPFGAPLPDDSRYALASFEASPLARRGRRAWDDFRWEVQSWMVSQFLHGEQGALVVAGRLVAAMPDMDGKLCAASQAVDEARHVEVFARYLREHVEEPYPVSPALRELLEDVITDGRWDVTALGMQIMVEALAMAAFRLANTTFHDDLITHITRLVARDEARHVSFGVLSLDGLYDGMTTAERADREEMVLDGAALIRRRFLLEDVWERLDVPAAEGVAYAAQDPLMVQYRQAIFSRIVSSLSRIGLMSDRVRDGLEGLGLLGFSGRRAARRR
jgi:hypothetical protein